MIMFYNQTISLSGNELKLAEKKALSQEDVLLQFFKDNAGKKYCRSDIERMNVLNAPTASYVRALNTLENAGKIVKLSEQVAGAYGKPQHLYMLKCESVQGSLF